MFDPLLELQNGSAALWFQLVGVNQYNHSGLSTLSYAAADCSGLVDVLREATESFPHRHFFVYHDHASQSPPLNAPNGSVAGTPSCRRVVESLNQMTSQAKKEDTIMFYFSGHGFLEDATGKLYLCFPETDLARLSETALDIQVLLRRMKDSKAERQVLVLDACHSGGAISEDSLKGKGAIALARSEQPVEEPADIPELNIAPKLQEVLEQDSVRRSKQDVCYLLSSDVDQLSWELRDVQHGAFTYCLMNGIRSTGVADEQGRIEVNRLYEHVRNQTRQIVHERSGRLQTPYLLRRGSRDIVIGFQDPAKMENLSQLPLSRRKEHYELVFRQYLAHDYPTISDVNKVLLNKLRASLRLPPKQYAEIEAPVVEEFEHAIAQYQQALEQSWRSTGQADALALRQAHLDYLGIAEGFLSAIDARISTQFNSDREAYHDAYLKALREHDQELNPQIIRALLKQQHDQLHLGDEVAAEAARKAQQDFEQTCATYAQRLNDALRQYGHDAVDPQNLKKWQRELQLGDRVVDRIQSEVEHKFEQDCDDFQATVRHQYFHRGQTDFAVIQQKRQELKLGPAVVAKLRQVEDHRFASGCQDYRQHIAQVLRSGGTLERPLCQQWQTEANLGNIVAQTIEAEERAAFQEAYHAYQAAAAHELRTHGTLAPSLLQQWRQRWHLEPGATLPIETAEIARLQADCEAYRQAIACDLRQQGYVEPQRRQDYKERSQLDSALTGPIDREEQQRYAADREVYRQQVADELHQTGALSAALKRQGQTAYGFGEEVMQEIEAAELALYAEDVNAYEQAIAHELCQHSQIRPETRLQLQQQCRLAAPVTDRLDLDAQNAFDAKRDRYQATIVQRYCTHGAVNEETLQQHNQFDFGPAVKTAIATQALAAFQQKQRQYLQAYLDAARHSLPTDRSTQDYVQTLRQSFGLSESIAKQCVEHYNQQLERYSEAFNEILRHYNCSSQELSDPKAFSLNPSDAQRLNALQQELQLFSQDIQDVEENVIAHYRQELLASGEAEARFLDELRRQYPIQDREDAAEASDRPLLESAAFATSPLPAADALPTTAEAPEEAPEPDYSLTAGAPEETVTETTSPSPRQLQVWLWLPKAGIATAAAMLLGVVVLGKNIVVPKSPPSLTQANFLTLPQSYYSKQLWTDAQTKAQAKTPESLVSAVQLASKIPGSATDAEVTTFIEECVGNLLKLAQQTYSFAESETPTLPKAIEKLEAAIAILALLPNEDKRFPAIANQQNAWNSELATLKAFKEAIANKQLSAAKNNFAKLSSNSPAWKAAQQELNQLESALAPAPAPSLRPTASPRSNTGSSNPRPRPRPRPRPSPTLIPF